MENSILKAALEYHHLGWCIIPIPYRTKKARIKWGKYQQQRSGEKQIRRWFANNNRNMAVVLGKVSNGLSCRDFDTMSEYELWAKEHPDLAETLPTVKTAKGRHVYFEGNLEGIKHISNGELRGGGGYCMLPPSIHPDGQCYEWINPLNNGNLLVIDNLENAGFLSLSSKNTNVTEHTEQSEQTEQSEAIEGGVDIEKAIKETLPHEFGTRNQKIFEFARYLKSFPQYADANPIELRGFVQDWHQMALPNIRTKEFEETWIDFLKAWPKVEYKIGEEPMAQIFEKALKFELPEVAISRYPQNKPLQLLTALCRELQIAAGDEPFFLAVRTAGRLLDVSPMTASRWLFLLESDRIIKVVCKGGTAQTPRRASRFKYIGGYK